MNRAIVQSQRTVTLLGGAAVSEALVRESMQIAPVLVAADGAAKRALAAGLMPQAVIGDMDSLDDATRAAIPSERLHPITEQQTTDFEKALRHIAAPLILAIGFTGQRLDHELAVYNALVRVPAPPVIVVGEHDICCHVSQKLRLTLEPGTRVSLFPMAPVAGRSTGLRWPIDGIAFAPDGRVGTSNEAIADRVTLSMQGPGMLLILPRVALRPLMQALAGG